MFRTSIGTFFPLPFSSPHIFLPQLLTRSLFLQRIQEVVLTRDLLSAGGFLGLANANRFGAAEKAVEQVVFTLQSLAHAWTGLLPATACAKALGRLINVVLSSMIAQIEALEDISDKESHRLDQLGSQLRKPLGRMLLSIVSPSSSIGVGTDPNEETEEDASMSAAATPYVPSWYKATYLGEILTGSLADISFLWFEAGALRDFAPSEVTHLIRALFSDSQKRADLIARIEQS